MLGWGYRFCEKRMLIENGMTTKEADKFMTKFDNICKSGLTEDIKQIYAASRILLRWEIEKDLDSMLVNWMRDGTMLFLGLGSKMKVFDLI